MKSINILTGLALLCLAGNVSAQNQVDALRYSQLGLGGTARVQGIGGAQAALGADAGNLAGNPAGLGLFRRSEFTFTPGINFNTTESNITGSSSVDQRNNVHLGNFGIIFSNRKSDGTEGNWRGGSFGVGFTQRSNLNTQFNYSGSIANNNTYVRYLANSTYDNNFTETELDDEYTNGIQTLEGLGYATYLTGFDTDENNNRYLYYESQNNVTRSESVISSGALNQWDFSYGASYRDKVYIGGALSLSTIRYNQERFYQELDADPNTYFTSLGLRDEFTTIGTGVNLRAGIIIRPTDILRIGASIQTPTFYSMNDIYDTSLNTSFQDDTGVQDYSEAMVPGEYSYRLTTPMRATAGVALFAGKYGFVTGDVEYLNYSNARLADNENSSEFSDVNNKISTDYKSAVNIKVGAEGRFDVFRVRAGIALLGDPYENSNFDHQRSYITGGVGIKQANYFVDLAVVNSKFNSVYSPYTVADEPQTIVTTKNRNNNVLVTLGVNF